MKKTSVFTRPLHLKLGVSKQFFLVLSVIYGGAGVLLIPLQLPLLLKITLWGMLLLQISYVIYYHILIQHHPANNATLHHGYLIYTNNQFVQILPSSYHHAYLIVLRLQTTKWQIDNLIIFPDAINPNTFRRLLVYLRHYQHTLLKTAVANQSSTNTSV
ncbi:protein YgfX [Beggiatoa leptomitoformis]|uniref:Toxin CptA n=1 Tax=Beggiatoa leptomitoformis TaxID=288004 RepID=A0A2N9YD62_9GAMM|nr:protein YgfX [Beggiatoa leptomitoformis]ALG69142.1 hypothetical protein AL038_17440 [Beggiatoa leptomitoformis]AUI68438.1 hypothetical protein BLE401_06780 [Beggiatoa leptomitoformis]